MGMDDAYKMINQTLVSLINEIWELEEKAIITDEFKDLTNNDMHVIEAIGLGEGNNMSSIARKLFVSPSLYATPAAAHAPVPDALVYPAPRSKISIAIFSLSITCMICVLILFGKYLAISE